MALPNLFMMSQGCILLLMLKQHLKELYRFTDSSAINIDLSSAVIFNIVNSAKSKIVVHHYSNN